MKSKIKRHSRSALAVVLTLCMLVSCMTVGIIATDAAKVSDSGAVGAKIDDNDSSVGAKVEDDEAVGATTYYLLMSTSQNPAEWTKNVTSTSQSFTITPSDLGLSSFATGTNYYVGISSSSSYTNMWSQGGSSLIGTTSGEISETSNESYTIGSTTYKFAHFSLSSAVDSVTVSVSYSGTTTTYNFSTSDASEVTWTVVGNNANLFGTTWAPTLTANDMTTIDSGATYTWSKSNVYLAAGDIEYKVAKNHAWGTTHPSSNATQTVSTAGYYDVTITYTTSNDNVAMTLTQTTKSTLTVANVANAVVKATYDGTTVQEGGSISDIPAGDSVTITVTPDTGYKCTAVTGTYNTSSTVSAAGSGSKWILHMPAADTSVSANLDQVGMKTIYFNNMYTGYSMINAYVKYASGGEPLGIYPGTTMTKLSNSNIWSISVPEDVDYVTFVGDNGYNTGQMTIPWYDSGKPDTTYNNPKYTAPYNHNDAPTIAKGGTWGEYITRSNVYTVTDGSTMSASNLFTGISATLYDYYTDGEIAASAGTAADNGARDAPNGWIKGIENNEYTWTDDGWNWIPYKKLNGALIGYADNTHDPIYDITYPLYFGNLNYNADASEVSGYYHYNKNANNSTGLNPNSTAVTGLSGKTLAGGNIHYYSASDTTNENGAPMAMFDEDFLSSENTWNTPLATILHTSSFPVRKEENVGATSDSVYFDINGKWDGTNIYAWVWGDGKTSKWVQFSYDNATGLYKATGVSGYTGMKVASMKNTHSDYASKSYDDLKSDICYGSNITGDIAITVAEKAYCKLTAYNAGEFDTFSSDTITLTGGHTYYEYDSTNGKDNAYIQSIDKANKTALINYYDDSSAYNKVHSNSNTDGFFPFNRNDYVPNQNKLDYAQDLGFGMKLEIPFTINQDGLNSDGTAQTFDFSGDDDLWVFIDNKLVLDLGGAHARTEGTINFNTKKITGTTTQVADGSSATRNDYFTFDTSASGVNTVHTMTIYYMERGMFDSNLKFGFSFHAVPNQYKTEKKIRTRITDLSPYAVNSGFYILNDTTRSDLQVDQDSDPRYVTWFEKSYQSEQFVINHLVGGNAISNKAYSLSNASHGAATTTGTAGDYTIKNDDMVYFLDQFTSGDTFTIKETPAASNKYVYAPYIGVYDDANNGKAVTGSGTATGGYTFDFRPTTTVTGGLENLNLRARFENSMVTHNLTVTKSVSEESDSTSEFTLQILFNFDVTGQVSKGYIAYPLYINVDGTNTQLSSTGQIKVTPGQVVTIPNIPENAMVQITEVGGETDGYVYSGTTVKTGAGTAVTTTPVSNAHGVTFAIGSDDVNAVVQNNKYKYSFTYEYPAYITSYGNQTYTVDGYITNAELDEYFTITNGALAFKDTSKKNTYLQNKAPYEDNFMTSLNVNTSVATVAYDSKNYTIKTTTNATYTPSGSKISVFLDLPYRVKNSANDLSPYTEDNKTYKNTDITYTLSDKFNFLDWIKSDATGVSSTGASDTAFLTAPKVLYDKSDTTKAYSFLYWSVSTQETVNRKSTEYTRCYSNEFNYALFQNVTLKAVYSNATTVAAAESGYKPADAYGSDTTGITVSFIENSRNQYNKFGSGGLSKNAKRNIAGDRVYCDFLLSYNNVISGHPDGLNELGNDYKCGIVVQAVQTLTENGSGGYVTSLASYDTNFSLSNNSEFKTSLENYIKGSGTLSSVAKSEFNVSELDNKNRIEYYYPIVNRKDNTLEESSNSTKLYRAFAYIKKADNSAVYISDSPAYFTIYDIASVANGGTL